MAKNTKTKIDHDYDPDEAMETVMEVVRGWDCDDLCHFLAECHPDETVRVGDAIQRYSDKTKQRTIIN